MLKDAATTRCGIGLSGCRAAEVAIVQSQRRAVVVNRAAAIKSGVDVAVEITVGQRKRAIVNNACTARRNRPSAVGHRKLANSRRRSRLDIENATAVIAANRQQTCSRPLHSQVLVNHQLTAGESNWTADMT